MTLQEILKVQGLTDEQIEKVIGEMKQNKIFTASEENLDTRYGKLKTDHEGMTKQLTEAQTLIEQLKKGTKGNEELQGKITTYEGQVADLQKQLQETKVKAAIKVALLSEKAVDVDYLTYKLNEKLNEKGETLEIDENDNIKGWDEKLSGLKTQFPKMFETASGGSDGKFKRADDGKLPETEGKGTLTRSEILKKSYAERQKIYEENPDAYNEAMNGK